MFKYSSNSFWSSKTTNKGMLFFASLDLSVDGW